MPWSVPGCSIPSRRGAFFVPPRGAPSFSADRRIAYPDPGRSGIVAPSSLALGKNLAPVVQNVANMGSDTSSESERRPRGADSADGAVSQELGRNEVGQELVRSETLQPKAGQPAIAQSPIPLTDDDLVEHCVVVEENSGEGERAELLQAVELLEGDELKAALGVATVPARLPSEPPPIPDAAKMPGAAKIHRSARQPGWASRRSRWVRSQWIRPAGAGVLAYGVCALTAWGIATSAPTLYPASLALASLPTSRATERSASRVREAKARARLHSAREGHRADKASPPSPSQSLGAASAADLPEVDLDGRAGSPAPSTGAGPTTVDATIAVEAVEPGPPEATPPSQSADVARRLPRIPSRRRVMAALRRVQPRMRRCVAPTRQGHVASVRFHFAPTGRVTMALTDAPHLLANERTCLSRAARRARLPRFRQRRFVVDYPFRI